MCPLAFGMGRRPAVDLREVVVEVLSASPRLFDHRREAVGLGFEDLDLSIDSRARIDEDGTPFGWVTRLAEALAVSLARDLVLQELADLGEGEPGIVAQASDE